MFDSLTAIAEPLPDKHKRFVIAPGDRGTAQTIDKMQLLVDHGKRDYSPGSVHDTVGEILQACPNKDWDCYAKTIFDWFRENIRYVYDANGVEVIETPAITLKTRKGDCDSQVIALAALYESIGMPTQIVTVKADATRPQDFSHVYLRVYIPNRGWTAADTTMTSKPFGWEPQGFPFKTWPASKDASDIPTGDGVTNMSSLGFLACGATPCAKCAASGLEGMGELPIDGGIYTNESYDFYADAPELGWQEPGSNWGLGSLPVVRGMNGMGRMGALSVGQATLLIEQAASGETYGELNAALARVRANLEYTANQLQAAQDSGDSEIIQAANTARNAILNENSTLQDAINRYNSFANDIQTYSLGYYKPARLSGMGNPAIIGAIVAGVLLTGSALAFAIAMNAYKGNVTQSDSAMRALADLAAISPQAAAAAARSGEGYFNQFGDAAKDVADAFSTSAGTALKVALIGGAAYIAFLALRKRGKI